MICLRPLLFRLMPVMLLALSACAAPAPSAGETAPAHDAVAVEASAAAPTPPSTAMPAPPMSTPLPPQRVGTAPERIDTRCKTDADCAVKDVGSCCGYAPACVNKDAATHPEAVKAQCASTGMASICGFRDISACTCTAGKCEAAGSDAGAR